jgi:Ankyrin repeats (3 copies)
MLTIPFFIFYLQTIVPEPLSPQQYLDAMIRSRGYSVTTYATLQSAYYNEPSPLQDASYGVYLIGLVTSGDTEGLRSVLAAGLSTNPSNSHGESLLHMICRRGDNKLLSVMLAAGCDVQVADDYGRTPLHDACWAAKPAFDVVEKLVEKDSRLFYLTDSRGAVPLSYVRKEHWPQWLQFLESKKDVYWPRRHIEQPAPALTLEQPNTRLAPQPENALTVELARMVANGRMTPAEATFLSYDMPHEETDSDDSDSDDFVSVSDEHSSDYCDSLDDDGSWDANDLDDILDNFASPKCRTLPCSN